MLREEWMREYVVEARSKQRSFGEKKIDQCFGVVWELVVVFWLFCKDSALGDLVVIVIVR
jgi:hypothetical protein